MTGRKETWRFPADVRSESETPTLGAPEALIRDIGTWGVGDADPATRTPHGVLLTIFLCIAFSGLLVDRGQFYFSYLTAFVFLASISLGALAFVMIQHLVGASWSVVVRRLAEHLMANLGWLALLAVPIFFGIHDLYHWSHESVVAGDDVLQSKSAYLNPPFFMLRTGLYFAVWLALAACFFLHSVRQDEDGSLEHTLTMRRWSAPGMMVYALTQTFAAFDWIMSLDPHWYSTIFGIYFFAGSFMAVHAAIALFVLRLRAQGHLKDVVTVEHDHDLGKFMFAFVVFWAYIAFSQFMLIWYANIPEETVWFKHRWTGAWKTVSLLLIFGHFAIPFLVLMSRHMKRTRIVMGASAAWLLFIHYVDIYWLVMPARHPEGADPTWIDAATLIGLGGAYLTLIFRRMGRHALVPARDPRLEESICFENH